jgi:CheY-like chemotaxis protein
MAKILIVDDEEVIRDMYADKFLNLGFQVVVAKDGVEALEKIEISLPDVVLLDILMPQMDGMATLKKIREMPTGKNLPVIILTNLDSNDVILTGVIQDHPAYYLMKVNITPEDVVEKVNEVLKQK